MSGLLVVWIKYEYISGVVLLNIDIEILNEIESVW